MNLYILIAKIVLVAFFLLMFLRSNKLVWGVGLLTVTTAILLDTLLSTFSREDMLVQLGFFFYIIVGALVAGGAIWLWGVLGPRVRAANSDPQTNLPETTVKRFDALEAAPPTSSEVGTAFDRQMLFDQMREQLGPDDLLDVIFDLGWPENDILAYGQDNRQLIGSIIERAEHREQIGDLTLAVERILTPIPKENLPRLEKLSQDSPPTILRHYLLAHYDMEGLKTLASEARVDWELLSGSNKKTKTRNLLLHLSRRNRVAELIDLLKAKDQTDI